MSDYQFTADQPADSGERLDRFLHARLPEHSRARLQDLIKSDHARLNGKPTKSGAIVRPGDQITLTIPDATAVEIVAQDIPIEILYQDSDILVINKPSGLVVHPAAGNPDGTLVNALLHHCDDLSGIGGETRPGIVHRLDKDTSGCIVVAKHDRSHRRLTESFADRRIAKTYLAVVNGVPQKHEGRQQNFIGRHPVDRKRMAILYDGAGKEAITEWKRLAVHKDCALIQCRLLTGRTHQIRVHMKDGLACPIIGDPIYGHPSKQKVPTARLMLHAWKLAFNHPLTERPLAFEATIPPEFHPWTDAANFPNKSC